MTSSIPENEEYRSFWLNFVDFKHYYISILDSNQTLPLPLDSSVIAQLTAYRDNGLHYVSNQAGNLLCFFAGICQELPEVENLNIAAQTAISDQSNFEVYASKESSNWAIYPNPSDGQFVIQNKEAKHLITQVEVLDATGRVMLMQRSTTQTHWLQINMNSLKTGSYYVRVTDEEGTVSTQLIYKQ